MTEKKSSLPSLISQNRTKIKLEKEKINKLITRVITDSRTKQSKLVYIKTKSVCDKNRCVLKELKQKYKTG